MDKKSLSPGKRVAIGIVVCAVGVGVVALGVYQLGPKANVFAAWEFAALPVGIAFAFGGAFLALPRSFVRTRALIAALMVTALALTADWIAFGPGDSGVRRGFSLNNVRGPLQTSQMLGRLLFGVGAVLADLLALWAWVQFLRTPDK
ncbi:MAG: hypothetical protein E6H50_00085 [Betaproteobacteria bacterium]|nr:MAG: hypothetical protein E6H50_00085 [Betaproteobacteria bacterium]